MRNYMRVYNRDPYKSRRTLGEKSLSLARPLMARIEDASATGRGIRLSATEVKELLEAVKKAPDDAGA